MAGYLLGALGIIPNQRSLNLIYREYVEFLNFHHLFQHRAQIEKETTDIKEKCEPKNTINQSERSHLSCSYCKASLAHSLIVYHPSSSL